MELLALLVVVLVVPLGLYLFHGRGRGPAWGLVPGDEEIRGDGAYRQTRVRTWKPGSAPLSVRLAALSSLFLGQMIVPGVLVAIVGMLVLAEMMNHLTGFLILVVMLLSAPTGIMVAAYLLSAGSAMLVRAADAVPRARRAARWALVHNGVLLPALGLVAAARPDEARFAFGPAVYACFSIAQALLVRRTASTLEAYVAREEGDPAPFEAELHVLGGIR